MEIVSSMLGNRRSDSIAVSADVISMILFLDNLLFDISIVRLYFP
jgi:hypothetical protein